MISQELSAQYATNSRAIRRVEERVEAVDARIKLIHDVVLEMMRLREDEVQTSLFRQIDQWLEARLRRIDMVGTPTVSGEEDPTTSEEDEEVNENDQQEEAEDVRSQHSGEYDPSEENERLMQQYRQALDDGDNNLADEIEREISDRWINLF